jgi:hypothetical protein
MDLASIKRGAAEEMKRSNIVNQAIRKSAGSSNRTRDNQHYPGDVISGATYGAK